MGRKITFEIAKAKFVERNKVDVELCRDGYNGWKKKSKFYDKVIGKTFWAIPESVLRQNSSHPKRKMEKIKKTNLKKYGVENVFQLKKIKEKSKKTNLKKYGVEHISQADIIKEKKREKWLKNDPFQIKKIIEKRKQTCIKRFNVENPFQIENVKNKIKINNTIFFVEETGETFKDWYNKQKKPKPSYTYLTQYFNKNDHEQVSLNFLHNFFKNYKENKTTLESKTEKLLKIKHYNQKPIQININCRPDFKLSSFVYLNVDGLYWHSDINKDKWYHYNLRKEFEDNNLRLFQFREDELCNKSQIVKSIINNSLGKTTNKIFARKCKAGQVKQKEANQFLKNNHLMGTINAKHLGLYYNNELVSLISYRQRKNVCKIERFCSIINIIVLGGFTKLLSYIEKNFLYSNTTEIHNWVDLRYGTGKHLLNKGFVHKRDTLGWKWTDLKTTYNRLRCRASMDERKLSQREHANELGWVKIYDAGQRLYIKHV